MRIIKTSSWQELCKKHDIPFFHITEFHKIPDGIKCVLVTGDNTFIHKKHGIESVAYGNRNSPYIEDVKFPDSLIFSTNASIWHEKVIPIPLGVLDFKPADIKTDFFTEKNITLYANFNEWCDRHLVRKTLEDRKYITWRRYSDDDAQEKYIADLRTSNFVISPFGNGFDCYRVWETIYSGAIPIVPRCVLFERFNTLPIIMLDHWDALSVKTLQQKYSDLKARGASSEQADLDYWEQIIVEA
jgi:hypothetical protein